LINAAPLAMGYQQATTHHRAFSRQLDSADHPRAWSRKPPM